MTKKNQRKYQWVRLAEAERIPHMHLCIVTNNKGEYRLARLDRSRDAWIDEKTKQAFCGGKYVMLIGNHPDDSTPLDLRSADGLYVKPEIK